MRNDQNFDFFPELEIAPANASEERRSLVLFLFKDLMEDFVDLPPAVGFHSTLHIGI